MAQTPTCHPNRKHKAMGLCGSCYTLARRRQDKELFGSQGARAIAESIHYRDPIVAQHVATVAIMHQLDMRKAVKSMKPELNEYEVARLANILEKAPQVSAAIQRNLEQEGLDDKSKDFFVKEVWRRFRYGTEKEKIAAMRLLGRAFIVPETTGKPIELRISGLEAGVTKMLGGELPEIENAALPSFQDITDALEEEDFDA